MITAQKQRGTVLPVALIMLVVLMLVAISSITMGTSSVQIVGNAQFREEATAAAQQAIENVISSTAFTLTPPTAQTIDINNDTKVDYTVEFNPAPKCLSVKKVNSEEAGIPDECKTGGKVPMPTCYWTTWDITAKVNDATTGANVVMHQGVRMIAGLNAALSSCGI